MPYMCVLGKGHLPKAAEKAAQKECGSDVFLVNYTDPQCNCGYGCRPHTCDRSRRHWFVGPNQGEPHDREIAKGIRAAVAPWVDGEGNARPCRKRTQR